MWGTPLLILLLGSGIFFLLYSRLAPFLYFIHAWKVLAGKYDSENEMGEISHFQALSTAMASTVGMGNISGVAVAIATGGPGSIFWMWISAIVGTATKFFTCSLAVMYRGKNDRGELQGGPMYVITEGLGKKWKFLAIWFSLSCMIGVLPLFQANQLNASIYEIVLSPLGIAENWRYSLIMGVMMSIIVALVVIGGLNRISKVAANMVPFMVILYFLLVFSIILLNLEKVLPSIILIFDDAFKANAVLGGSIGSIILIGVKRGTFSNEAGLGTAPMAHGAAKTNEPIREGLVGMLGPFIDTIIVCSLTALAIIISGVWKNSNLSGISLTTMAFKETLPYGHYFLAICVLIFSITTMFSFPYYGMKAYSFVFGTKTMKYYSWFYISTILVGVLVSLDVVINIIDGFFAMMAIPTLLSAIILSPKVIKAGRDYFGKIK